MSYSFFDVSNNFNYFNIFPFQSNTWWSVPNFLYQNPVQNIWNPVNTNWNNYNFWNPSVFQNAWDFSFNWNPFFNLKTPCTTCSSEQIVTTSTQNLQTPQSSSEVKPETTSVTTAKKDDKPKDCFCNYNVDTGEKLAKIVLKNSHEFHNQCATHVQNAIAEAGLGKSPNVDAYQMLDVLRNNKNFEEVSVKDVKLQDVPAGCILVYDRDVEGVSKEFGHVEITLGDGRAASDGITEKLIVTPTAIFAPVV